MPQQQIRTPGAVCRVVCRRRPAANPEADDTSPPPMIQPEVLLCCAVQRLFLCVFCNDARAFNFRAIVYGGRRVVVVSVNIPRTFALLIARVLRGVLCVCRRSRGDA